MFGFISSSFSQKIRQNKLTFSDSIPAFNSIIAKGNVNITYRQDNYYSITFYGSKSFLKDVYSSIKVEQFCLKIDAGKLFANEVITVEIIAPFLDTIRLYDNATFLTPTNVWLKRLYIESYSQYISVIYVNASEFNFKCRGKANIILSGIIDLLYIENTNDVKLEINVISKFLQIKSFQNSKCIAKGQVFVCECHAFQHAIIDATDMQCGRAKAFASEQSSIYVKSEEKPIILSLGKGKINFLNNDAIVVDSTGIKNIKKINE